MKGFKDTTRVQYFKGGQVTREKACGGAVKKAEGGRVTDPVKNKTGGKNDPEYGDYEASRLMVTKRDAKGDWKEMKPSRLEVTKRDPKGNWKEMKPVQKAEGGVVNGREKYADDTKRGRDMRLSELYSDTSVFSPKLADGSKRDTTNKKSGALFRKSTPSPQDIHDYIVNKPMKKAEGGKVDMKQDKKAVAAGVHKHERALHPGKPMTKMQRGGFPSHSKAPLIKAR